jgi:hypothetical protein
MAGEFRRRFFVIFQRLKWKILPGGRQDLPIEMQHKKALKDGTSVPSAGRRATRVLASRWPTMLRQHLRKVGRLQTGRGNGDRRFGQDGHNNNGRNR